MAIRPTCAILLGLPADRTEFDAVASGAALPDYRRGLIGNGAPAAVWDRRYVRIVEAIGNLCEAAAAVGGCTFRAARIADVTQATTVCDTVILIAHWRGWQVATPDLREPAAAIEDRLRHGGLAELLPSCGMSAAELVAALNRAIESGTLQHRLAPELDAYEASAALKATVGRDVLDELLGDAIHPGNRVELFDGLHPPGAIEEAVDPGFRGTIDLATCASASLAAMISMRRGPRVHLVHTVDAVDPLSCCLLIAHTLRHAHRSGASYASARQAVAAALHKCVEDRKCG